MGVSSLFFHRGDEPAVPLVSRTPTSYETETDSALEACGG